MHVLIRQTLIVLSLAGSVSASASGAKHVFAALIDPAGISHGSAILFARHGKIHLMVNARGMTPGAHGIHIHAIGICDAPDFKTAGGHWNPSMKQHGRDNPMGMHAGDLPNLVIRPDGTGHLTAVVEGSIDALMDPDGASIVIHAAADDNKTDPSGNSGARAYCGVLTRRPG